MTFLRAVLFAKGTGADVPSYQPNRDESQWWNRRDALVRCVAAFLFGPFSSNRELILLFEDDWSRMYMTYVFPKNHNNKERIIVPKEQTIVGLWKKAAQHIGESVQERGLTCRLCKNKTKSTASNIIPSNLESKRDVLEQLQAICSMEFLREKGLNSSSKVLLKKLNKQTLTEIGKEWNTRYANQQSNKTSLQDTLGPILEELLKPLSVEIKSIVAATLHESSHHELPCWNRRRSTVGDDEDDKTTQTCIFLGAVRDMTLEENMCLQQTCKTFNIPQVTVRLGPVPEFTSKILSVVAYHHAHQQFWSALQTLLLHDGLKKRPQYAISPSSTRQSAVHLHFVMIIPFPSTSVTTDLHKRDRSLWCLVRSVVTSLWRSRLAGTHEDGHVTNTLTLWFTDKQYLSLQQNELVTLLAEKHQAAPTEFQILQALQDQLSSNASKAREASATAILNSILLSPSCNPRVLLDLDKTASKLCLTNLFYQFSSLDEEANGAKCGGTAIMLFSMQSADDLHDCRQAKVLFRDACQTREIPIVACSFRDTDCQDFEASAITMLQHFCYQGLLFPAIQRQLNISSSSKQVKKAKKRRKKSD